jgi:hypothetical protein
MDVPHLFRLKLGETAVTCHNYHQKQREHHPHSEAEEPCLLLESPETIPFDIPDLEQGVVV